ncbi:MAG: hypothetical protein KBT47_06775, partial [Armatimonadetes bacterium]|nr:hypothetical protein [Candidatus Hippobium faecium]
PNIILGYMHADAVACNSDFAYFAKKLSGKNCMPVKFRPGGGVYTDYDKNGFITKALYLGRQVSNIPKEYRDIQSELENFPYNQLHKSAYANVIESLMYIGAGCTGVTYNTHHQESWGSEYSAAEENECRFSEIMPYREFFDQCVETFGREPNRGVYCDNDTMSFYSKNFEEGNWLYGEHRNIPTEMYNIGFSPAFRREDGQVFYAFDETFASLTDEEIKEILSKSVYMNGRALKYLWKRGFGEYVGFKVLKTFETDCHEFFLENELNKDFTGYRRECRYAFYGGEFYGLAKTDQKAEYLGKFNDFSSESFTENGEELYSMGIYENSLGGRICVGGYKPDECISCYPKTVQLKRVFAWLSRNTVSYIKSYVNVNYFDRGVGGLIFNNSYDKAKNTVLALPKDTEKIILTDKNMNKKEIIRSAYINGYSEFDLGDILPFDFALVKY